MVLLCCVPLALKLFAQEGVVSVSIPIDPSMRSPLASVFVATPNAPLPPWDHIRAMRYSYDAPSYSPRNRRELVKYILDHGDRSFTAIGAVVDDADSEMGRAISASIQSGATVLRSQWHLLVVGGAFLVLGLLTLFNDRHPVSSPIAGLTTCMGISLVASVDLVVPGVPDQFYGIEPTARIGTLAWVLLPAPILHLATRFPVAQPRMGTRSLVVGTYVVFLAIALIGQLRFFDATVLNGLEKMVFVLFVISATVLAIVGGGLARELTPIEHARARALLVGFGAAGLGPLVVLYLDPSHSVLGPQIAALPLLALPGALGWSMVRYNLLDPPIWLRGALVSAANFVAAVFITVIGISVSTQSIGSEPPPLLAIALGTSLVFVALQSGVRRLVGRRLRIRDTANEFLATASSSLAGARTRTDVLRTIHELVQSETGAGAVIIVGASFSPDPSTSALESSGREVWLDAGAPHGRVLVLSERSEDPSTDRAELVASFAPPAGEAVLLIASARHDGLPYSTEEAQVLERIVGVVEVALAAAANTHQLQSEVTRRTEVIARSLQDRMLLLDTVRRIHEAEGFVEVRKALETFVLSIGGDRDCWRTTKLPATDTSLVQALDFPVRSHSYIMLRLASADRISEATSVFETVCVFANLSLARLNVLAKLREEVSEQSDEIARVKAESYRADFVRSLAHELRKPAKEAEALSVSLAASVPVQLISDAYRIRSIAVEFQRRLDVLLNQSQPKVDFVRFDLASLVHELAERAQILNDQCKIEQVHEYSTLPMVGDPTRIRSVIENLMDNAIKATDACGRVIVSTALRYPDGPSSRGPHVVVSIADDGAGIPVERLDSIFEPGISFFPGGFGLGLPFCRATALAHNGVVSVSSNSDETRFDLILPQVPPGDDADDE